MAGTPVDDPWVCLLIDGVLAKAIDDYQMRFRIPTKDPRKRRAQMRNIDSARKFLYGPNHLETLLCAATMDASSVVPKVRKIRALTANVVPPHLPAIYALKYPE